MESGNFALDAMVIGPEWTEWKHQFIAEGVAPFCDVEKKTINSPAFKLHLTKRQEELIRGKNLHEAAHAHYTPVCKEEHDPQLHSILNALEDLRIERLLGQENTLFANDLRKMNQHIFQEFKDRLKSGTVPAPEDEALCWMMFQTNDFEDMFTPSDKAQTLIDKALPEFSKWKKADTFEQILDLGKKIQQLWNEPEKDPSDPNQSGENGEKSQNENPEKENAPSPQNGNEEKSKTPAAPSPGEQESAPDSPKKKKKQGFSASDEKMPGSFQPSLRDKILDEAFKDMCQTDEKEGEYRRFTENDRFEVPLEDKERYEIRRECISGHIMKISQYTRSALQALSRCKISTGLESGLLDKRKLAAIASNAQRNIFYRTVKGISLNTAITILLDASGSMCNNEGGVISLCIALAEAFENLQMPFEILGFTTDHAGFIEKIRGRLNLNGMNPELVRIVPLMTQLFKQFSERFQNCKYRIGSYRAKFDNIDGESLAIAWNRNRVQRTERHIVFVISDGSPLCIGMSRNALEKDLKRTVKEIRSQGGEVYAFGLGTDSPMEFYGEENFVYIRDVSELGVNFFQKFRKVISR